MKNAMLLVLLCLAGSLLWGQLTYAPLTTIAEDFTSTSCTSCPPSYAGLDVIHSQTHPGQFISVRYYTQSGANYSFPAIDDRIAYYETLGTPTVYFNGKNPVAGGGEGIANGALYRTAYSETQFGASPIKMEVLNFNALTMQATVKVTLLDPTYNLTNVPIYFLLMQDNVTPTDTHVTRDILLDSVTLSGAGTNTQFVKTFAPSMTVNHDSLWVAAFVQTADKTILQATSSLPTPANDIRPVLRFKPNFSGEIGYAFQSPHFVVMNLGQTDNLYMNMAIDSAPQGWIFGFCSTEGLCFPSDMDVPFSVEANSYAEFYLDVVPNSSGVANFHLEIGSTHGNNPFIIPMTFHTSDANDDNVSSAMLPNGGLRNYPNPFGKQTAISYQLNAKQAQQAKLDIYNVKGQLVKTFSHLSVTDNRGFITWQGDDENGKNLPAGVYFSRLRNVEGARAHKLLLVR